MRFGEQTVYDQVGLPAARRELERLLGDPRFAGTERARKILTYIAELCFNGETEGVKAYAIALDVLSRPSKFDSNADPIVRIEVSRLRGALSSYYDAFGSELDVTINLPIGRYITVFTRNERHDPAVDTVQEKPDEEAVVSGPRVPPLVEGYRSRRYYAVGASAVILLVLGVIAWSASSAKITVKPAVRLVMSAADASDTKEADMMENYLVTAMSQFKTLDISSGKTIKTSSLSDVLRPAAGKSYTIDMKYYSDDDDRTVWWQIINTGGGVIKSGIERVQVGGRSGDAARAEMVSVLAKQFAGTRGVINSFETHDDASTRSLGNSCVLRAEFAVGEGGREGIRSALPCLEQTVALQPNNVDAVATLSRVLVAAEGADPATTPFDRAMTLANRAVSLDPASDRAQVALMTAYFYSGSMDAAIAAGNRAFAINPNNPEVLSKLAAVLYSSGYQPAAVSLAEDATRNVDSVPRDASIILALDAYGRSDFSNASLIAEQVNCSDFVVRAIRAAALGQMASREAPAKLAYLKEMLPDYETSLSTWMGRRKYPAQIVSSLKQGLAKAAKVSTQDASPALMSAN
jgi:tetratricopeptide (TPR) repeat protein